MTMDLGLRRQFFAEEIAAVANLKTPQLIEALASLPREKFLRPGPWLVRGEVDFSGGARTTVDAEARHVLGSLHEDGQRHLFGACAGGDRHLFRYRAPGCGFEHTAWPGDDAYPVPEAFESSDRRTFTFGIVLAAL
jgi:hypothetical protein